jgi:hypothetical protein
VPATVARIRVVPNERIETGTRLVQRALHAEITIDGQHLADVVAGEAVVGAGDVSCGGVADLALQCTLRRLVLIDVYEQAGRVRLLGATDRRYVGRRVRIRFMDSGRMVVSEMSSRRGVVTIAGRVVQPLADPVRTVLVKRRATCRRWKLVKRFTPASDGRFRVRLKAPRGGRGRRVPDKVRLTPPRRGSHRAGPQRAMGPILPAWPCPPQRPLLRRRRPRGCGRSARMRCTC